MKKVVVGHMNEQIVKNELLRTCREKYNLPIERIQKYPAIKAKLNNETLSVHIKEIKADWVNKIDLIDATPILIKDI